jgi:hypothetical protein
MDDNELIAAFATRPGEACYSAVLAASRKQVAA